MVVALRDRGRKSGGSRFLQQTLHAEEQMVRMKAWIEGVLRRHTSKHPLVAQNLSGDSARDQSVYLADDGRIACLENWEARSGATGPNSSPARGRGHRR